MIYKRIIYNCIENDNVLNVCLDVTTVHITIVHLDNNKKLDPERDPSLTSAKVFKMI